MSEDIIITLRAANGAGGRGSGSGIAFDAAADMAKETERLRSNLTEALRLMEPVAEAEEATHWPYVVTVVRDDARAIADFVKRMRGGSNE